MSDPIEELRKRLPKGSNKDSLRAMSDEGLLGGSAEAILDAAAEELFIVWAVARDAIALLAATLPTEGGEPE